jgi:hypothetical protein
MLHRLTNGKPHAIDEHFRAILPGIVTQAPDDPGHFTRIAFL